MLIEIQVSKKETDFVHIKLIQNVGGVFRIIDDENQERFIKPRQLLSVTE